MKFDQKYPGAEALDEPDASICKFSSARPCWHCGAMTTWADIDFGAWLCSEECLKAKWEEFKEACERGDTEVVKKG